MLESSCRNFEACRCFVRNLWRCFSAAEGRGTCRTPAQAEGRRVRPAHYWNNCCSRCLRSFYSGAATQTWTARWHCCEKEDYKGAMKEKPTFLRAMENSFWHCLHWVASSSFSQAWPWREQWTYKIWLLRIFFFSNLAALIVEVHRSSHFTFRALLTSLKSSILSLDLQQRWMQHKNMASNYTLTKEQIN